MKSKFYLIYITAQCTRAGMNSFWFPLGTLLSRNSAVLWLIIQVPIAKKEGNCSILRAFLAHFTCMVRKTEEAIFTLALCVAGACADFCGHLICKKRTHAPSEHKYTQLCSDISLDHQFSAHFCYIFQWAYVCQWLEGYRKCQDKYWLHMVKRRWEGQLTCWFLNDNLAQFSCALCVQILRWFWDSFIFATGENTRTVAYLGFVWTAMFVLVIDHQQAKQTKNLTPSWTNARAGQNKPTWNKATWQSKLSRPQVRQPLSGLAKLTHTHL